MIKLPDNPTPEQFKKAEPVLLKAIIEETYTDGIDQIVNYRMVKPGKYQGEFRDGKKRFSFDIDTDKGNIGYKPINPEEID